MTFSHNQKLSDDEFNSNDKNPSDQRLLMARKLSH